MYDLDFFDDGETLEAGREATDLDPQERLVTAALLTATAFRLKDADGLILALRSLLAAVGAYSADQPHA